MRENRPTEYVFLNTRQSYSVNLLTRFVLGQPILRRMLTQQGMGPHTVTYSVFFKLLLLCCCYYCCCRLTFFSFVTDMKYTRYQVRNKNPYAGYAGYIDDVVLFLHPPAAALTKLLTLQYVSLLTLEFVITPFVVVPHRAPLPQQLCRGDFGSS